ncbi:MAG: succinate dehydrogenase iron-sulfur subunit [Thermoproteota archaeon]|nr:succinate dehydrogenase iron-sulfur subunit [Thermoproteota archaeon]
MKPSGKGSDERISLTKKTASSDNRPAHEESKQTINLRVFRGSFLNTTKRSFSTFNLPFRRWTTVLDALIYAKEHLDSSIAIRFSCRMASCGSCGMMINGIPRLACYTKISDLKSDTVTCEPLPNFPVIRDLVTDFQQFFNHHKDMKPFIENRHPSPQKGELTEFKQTPSDIDKYLQFSYCIRCGLCYSACPTVATDTKFPGPQALSQAYRYFADNRDEAKRKRLDKVDDRHGIWRCHFAGSCSAVCPKGVDPALGIQLLRSHLMNISKVPKTLAELRKIDYVAE